MFYVLIKTNSIVNMAMRQIVTFIFVLFASLMANAVRVKIDRFYYYLNNETKTAAISGSGLSGDIVIPSKVNYNDCTYIVTTIEEKAFWYCSSLTSVSIGDSVTSIGSRAFYNCDSLTSVSIGSSVSSIGSGAFYNCYNLKYVYITDLAAWCNIDFDDEQSTLFYNNNYSKLYLNGQEVKDLVIPDSVTTIRKFAFYKYKNLRSLVIPNSVTSIGNYAFDDCGVLKSVTIGSSVASIGSSALNLYNAKKAIWLANTPPINASGAEINYVSNDQFKFENQKVYPFISSKFEVDNVVYVPVSPSERTCDVIDCNYNSLSKTVKIDSLVTNRNVQLKVLNVNPYAFYNNDSINEIIINNYDSIGDYAFADCYKNGALTIGRSVTSIGSNAFYRNIELKDVVIPDNITNVGFSAFAGCSLLKSVKIGTGIDILNESLFRRCSSISSIIIPNSINTISYDVFSYCDSLQYVIFSDASETEKSKINIPTSLFKGCPLVDVYIGRKLSYDTSSKNGYSPFYCNKTLRSVKITDKETTIYNNEFYGCTNLTSFEYGKNVTIIGEYAFYGASSLGQFAIQDSVINVGKFAFAGCSSLESIKLGKGIESLNESLFDGCKSLEDIIIPSNIRNIGYNAFKGCSTLGDVTFEDSGSKITLGYNSDSSPLFADCPLDEVYIRH